MRKDTNGPAIPGAGTTPSPEAEFSIGMVGAEFQSRALSARRKLRILSIEISFRSKLASNASISFRTRDAATGTSKDYGV